MKSKNDFKFYASNIKSFLADDEYDAAFNMATQVIDNLFAGNVLGWELKDRYSNESLFIEMLLQQKNGLNLFWRLVDKYKFDPSEYVVRDEKRNALCYISSMSLPSALDFLKVWGERGLSVNGRLTENGNPFLQVLKKMRYSESWLKVVKNMLGMGLDLTAMVEDAKPVKKQLWMHIFDGHANDAFEKCIDLVFKNFSKIDKNKIDYNVYSTSYEVVETFWEHFIEKDRPWFVSNQKADYGVKWSTLKFLPEVDAKLKIMEKIDDLAKADISKKGLQTIIRWSKSDNELNRLVLRAIVDGWRKDYSRMFKSGFKVDETKKELLGFFVQNGGFKNEVIASIKTEIGVTACANYGYIKQEIDEIFKDELFLYVDYMNLIKKNKFENFHFNDLDKSASQLVEKWMNCGAPGKEKIKELTEMMFFPKSARKLEEVGVFDCEDVLSEIERICGVISGSPSMVEGGLMSDLNDLKIFMENKLLKTGLNIEAQTKSKKISL